jgi:hypothetical protein
MSMYVDLLKAVIGDGPDADALPTGELVLEVVRRRGMARVANGSRGPGLVPTAVADQLGYDVALVQLCRRLGIGVDLGSFDCPSAERRRLEEALQVRGVMSGPLMEHEVT